MHFRHQENSMKIPRAALITTAIPLLLTSLPLAAGELPFNAPGTERAKESAPLLHQTAQALYDLSSRAALGASSAKHISNLWLFPTANADTVFARYNLTADDEATSDAAAAATEHLTVLTVHGNRILESRELTSAHPESTSNEPARLHWSAAIGTGHAASTTGMRPMVTGGGATNTDATRSSHGVPASPHWSAGIGTGTAATSATNIAETKQASPSGIPPAVATAHWTSRIGTGHASDSTTNSVTHASLVNAR
jgi:hypothetical protein